MKNIKPQKKLTQQQKACIYCIKNGHADFVWSFWGYIHCGRCGEQIGDTLGGVFSRADKVIVLGCKKKPCDVCDPIRKKLSKLDKQILRRLEKVYGKDIPDYKKILKDIKFD